MSREKKGTRTKVRRLEEATAFLRDIASGAWSPSTAYVSDEWCEWLEKVEAWLKAGDEPRVAAKRRGSVVVACPKCGGDGTARHPFDMDCTDSHVITIASRRGLRVTIS